MYCVTSKNGGTLTDATGTLNETIEAGKQLHVTAPSDRLLIDDDEAIMRQANFKRARLALRMLGAGVKSELPAGYTKLEFLQGTGKQYINAQTPADSTSEVLCVFERLDAANKTVYSTSTNQNKTMFNCFVWGGNLNDLRFDWGSKNYGVKGKYNGGWVTSVQSANGVYLNGEQVITHAQQEPFSVPGLVLFTFSAVANEWTANNVRISRWTLKTNGKQVRDMVAALAPTGEPCMYDRVSKQPFKKAGTGQFIAGFTLAQAAQLGRNLPSTGGSLTVSLPEGYDSNEGVVNSLAEAEARGWVLTIQTYAAETAAATYSLRRVWVRREQSEHGSYVSADGSRWQVDWCVDVIGADPESLGYERFRSVEVAAEYWGLTPYEYPEELSTIE